MRTTELIAVVSQDRHVATMPEAALRTAVAAGLAIAAGLFFSAIGPRPDIDAAARTARFLFKFVLTGTLAATALGMLLRIARPDRLTGPWRWSLVGVPALLVLAVAAELIVTPASQWGARLVGTNARLCLTLIPLLSMGPLACLLIGLRWSAPVRPDLAGAVAGLAASGMAALFYAANCTDDSPLFVALWYPPAVALVTATGTVIGARVLRW